MGRLASFCGAGGSVPRLSPNIWGRLASLAVAWLTEPSPRLCLQVCVVFSLCACFVPLGLLYEDRRPVVLGP